MNRAIVWSRILIVIGLAAMLVGAIDPLEGSFIILPGVGLVALGALVGRSRRLKLLVWGFGLVAFGVAAMMVLSWFGGIGGAKGHSVWWGLFIVPYPIGWIMVLVGAARTLIDSRSFRAMQPGAS